MQDSTNRRDFFKATGAAAVAAGLVGSGVLGKATQAARAVDKSQKKGKKMKVQVHHEWGALKEVVCGIPYLKIPTALPKCLYNFAPTEGIKFLEANLGKTLEEADKALYKDVTKQMDAAIGILEDRGVKVHRPKSVNEVELEYLDKIFPASVVQIYPRDPMLVIGNRFIETELFMPIRRRERFGIRRALADRLAASNAQVVSMPPAVPSPEDDQGGWGPGPFIEGGDVFLLGQDIYVGVSGNASNTAGVKWLQQHLGKKHRVHEIALTKKFLHLDCCLATPRPGLAIICREAFVDGLPAFLKDWTLIDVPFEDAKEKLACNGLVLDEKSIMIDSGLDDLAKGLRDAGQQVVQTPFDAIYQFAGAFRCWHHPLVRESTLEKS